MRHLLHGQRHTGRGPMGILRKVERVLGTVVLQVTPPDARVSINEAPLSPEALKNPVRLAAGEYRLAVEASCEIGLKLYGLRNSGASGQYLF